MAGKRHGRARKTAPGHIGLFVLVVVYGGFGALSAWGMNLPPGYSRTNLVLAANVSVPTKMAWAPDGRLWIAGADFKVMLLYDSNLYTALTLPFSGTSVGERAIAGLAVDPEYLQNQRVWIYYTYTGGGPVRNRLSHFQRSGNSLINETVIFEVNVVSPNHNGGCLVFAPDKTLYLGLGDDSMGSNTAQNPHDPRGSILHLNRDGSPAADNPYLDGVNGNPRVWATGARNPFSCVVQPGTGTLMVSDVGGGYYEEINLGYPGANFGWPATEGPLPAGLPYVYAFHHYAHNGSGAAIMAGDFVGPGEFNPDLEGFYFYADYARKEIRVMEIDDDLNVLSDEVWATDTGFLTDLEFGPDGDLYYTCNDCAMVSVGKIEWFSGLNAAPRALTSVSPTQGTAPLSVTFDGSPSSDPDDDPLTYDWDFGDGTSDSGSSVVKQYPAGVYEAVLTVADDQGADDVSMPIRIVSGNRRPTATITAPLSASGYDAGGAVNYSGAGNDPENGALWCARFTWQVLYHSGGKTYPIKGPIQGSCGDSFLPSAGVPHDLDATYEIRLTVTDTGAPLGTDAELTDSTSISIGPNTAELSFQTEPYTDLQLLLDGVPFSAPQTFDSIVGMTRQVGAVERQLRGDGHHYSWIAWSDNQPQDHAVSMTALPASLTATFGCDVILEVTNVNVQPSAVPGELDFTWDPVNGDPCETTLPGKYRLYAADSAKPTPGMPVDFPNNPHYVLVASVDTESFTYAPPPEHQYFIVVAVGTDLRPGYAGHYGR